MASPKAVAGVREGNRLGRQAVSAGGERLVLSGLTTDIERESPNQPRAVQFEHWEKPDIPIWDPPVASTRIR